MKYANQYRHHLKFNIGDKVLLSTKNINNPVDKNRPTRKLAPKFIGPYTISTIISTTAYKLDLPTTMRIYPVFHISLLKPYKKLSEKFTRPTPPFAIFIPETNQDEYKVKTILNRRIIHTRPQYLVKWLG